MTLDKEENADIDISNQNNKTILALLVYCASGTLLTLLNKLAIVICRSSNILLMMQNGVTVILLLLISQFFPHTFKPMPSINVSILKLWLPLVLLFVVMLTSSLLSLLHVSIPTVIVMRNLSTLFVAMLEHIRAGQLNSKNSQLNSTQLLDLVELNCYKYSEPTN